VAFEAALVSELMATRAQIEEEQRARADRTLKPEGNDIRRLLALMVEKGASDLHLKAGSPPGLRVDGALRPLGHVPLSGEDTARLAREILTEEQFERFKRTGDLDTSHAIPGVSRFRVNAMVQRGAMGLVIRRVPDEVPRLEELGLPAICRTLAERPRGLVLVTGPTGSGKSTTLAAMLNHVNGVRRGHILTMEDPIEFLHKDKGCWVTQREIGSDSATFPSALRHALRQDPDVILVGEMRDLETISLAMTAAETGHLVFATLHTTSAIHTASRIIDVFPPIQQQQIRLQFADNLQGIISQTLLAKVGGGRVGAYEVLVATDAVRALIRENKTPQLLNLIQTGAKDGMQTLESSLNDLLAQRLITYETAVARAHFPAQIQGGPTAQAASAKRPARR
jgi:twitching motility protein PilT